MNLKSLKNKIEKEMKKTESLKELDKIFKKYLGKKGELSQILRSLKDLPEKERKKQGREANQLNKDLKKMFKAKSKEFQEINPQEEWFDITAPGKKLVLGHLHPITIIRRKVEEIFQSMGFSVVEGPEIETEWYNFDALNFPKIIQSETFFHLGKHFI